MTAPVPPPPADDQAARARKVGQALAAAEFYDAVEDDVARVLADEVKRLQARNHEIQAQEMTKRAALDSELAEWRQRYEEAKRWTERNELRAEWASGQYAAHPFWSMTSYNARSALLRLVTERDESVARLAAVRALADYLENEARAGRVAPQLYAVGALIRARLDGPAEAPAPEPDPQPVNTALLDRMREGVTSREPAEPVECDSCGHVRTDHDADGVCRAAIRPAWAPDDECWCGRFVPVSVGPVEAAEPAPDEKCTPAEEAHDEMCPGCDTCLWPARTAAEAGAPEPSDWICDTCGARRGEHEGKDHAFFIFQGNGPAGSVTITPPEPGYQRIADAIQQLCEESAEVQIQLRPTKAGVTEWIGDQYLRLAQILDRAGLIDWTAFQDSPLPKETQQ